MATNFFNGDLILPQEIEANSPISVQFKPITKSTQSDAKEAMEAGAKGDTLYLSTGQTMGQWIDFNAPIILQNKVEFTCLSTSSPISLISDLPAYTLLTAAAIYKAVKNLCLN